MKCRLQSFILPLTTAWALTFCLFSTASAQTPYTGGALVQLFGGGCCDSSTGYAINAFGTVTGTIGDIYPGRSAFFVYNPSTGLNDGGTLGGDYSVGLAINASEEVTGYSTLVSNFWCPTCEFVHAFLYTPSGGITDLETLGGDESMGTGINAKGEVVGWSDLANGERHAFLYSGGTMKDLGGFNAVAINDNGEITGSDGHVFSYSNGSIKDLGIAGTGKAINDSGQITGFFLAPDQSTHGFLYSSNTMTDLGVDKSGQSINNFSQVVGGTWEGAPPFLYSPTTGIAEISSLLSTVCNKEEDCVPWDGLIDIANGVNDAGQITGEGRQPWIGNPWAVLFSPVTSSLSAFQAKLQFIGKGETRFRLRGSFTLGTDSNGLDPLTQQVLLQLGSLPLPIQTGLFKQASNGDYVFQGVVGPAAIDFRIEPVTSTRFKFEVEGLTATPFRLTNPARFILMIGNNKTMGKLPWR